MPFTTFGGSGSSINETQVNSIISSYSGTTSHNHLLSQITGLIDINTNKINNSLIPSIAISDVFVVLDISARDNLTVQTGDVAKVSSDNKCYIYDGIQWIELSSTTLITNLSQLTGDMNISNPLSSNILVYNTTSQKWSNVKPKVEIFYQNLNTIPESQRFLAVCPDVAKTYIWCDNNWSELTCSGLSNSQVDIFHLYDKHVLIRRTNKWQNDYLLTSDIGDFNITGITNNQSIKWDTSTSKFIAYTPISSVSSSTDVNIQNLSNGSILRYDTSTSKWNASSVLSSFFNTITNLSTNNLLLSTSVGSLSTAVLQKGITSANNLITVGNTGTDVTLTFNVGNLNSDLITQGTTNLFWTTAKDNVFSLMQSMANVTLSISDPVIGVANTTNYIDENLPPVALQYTPNTSYGIMTTAMTASIKNHGSSTGNMAQNLLGLGGNTFQQTNPMYILMPNGQHAMKIWWDMLSSYSSNAVRYRYAGGNNSYLPSFLQVYASNDPFDYNNNFATTTMSANSNLVFSGNISVSQNVIYEKSFSFTNPYRYWCAFFQNTGTDYYTNLTWSLLEYKLSTPALGGTYANIFEPTNFTINSNSTTGYPQITRVTGSGNVLVSLHNLNLFESYRRVFPTIRDASMKIQGGLITSTVPIYNFRTIPVGAFSDIGGTQNDASISPFTFLRFPVNATGQFSITLPDNYKSGTSVLMFLNIYMPTGGNGFLNFTYSYMVVEPLFTSNLTPTTVASFEVDFSGYSSGSHDFFIFNGIADSKLKSGSVIMFYFKRINSVSTPAFSTSCIILSANIKYQVDSYASL